MNVAVGSLAILSLLIARTISRRVLLTRVKPGGAGKPSAVARPSGGGGRSPHRLAPAAAAFVRPVPSGAHGRGGWCGDAGGERAALLCSAQFCSALFFPSATLSFAEAGGLRRPARRALRYVPRPLCYAPRPLCYTPRPLSPTPSPVLRPLSPTRSPSPSICPPRPLSPPPYPPRPLSPTSCPPRPHPLAPIPCHLSSVLYA